MKRIAGFFTIIGLAICAHAVHAQSFEGVLSLSASGSGKTYQVEAEISGKKARIVPRGDQGADQYPIFDYPAMKLILVSTKDKYYTEMPLDSALKTIGNVEMAMSSTGRRENIQGMDAEEYRITNTAKAIDVFVWGTSSVRVEPNFLLGLQQQGGADGAYIAKAAMLVFEKGLLPLRIDCAGKANASPFHWEVTKVERKPIAPASFGVPAGFQTLSGYLKKNNKATRVR